MEISLRLIHPNPDVAKPPNLRTESKTRPQDNSPATSEVPRLLTEILGYIKKNEAESESESKRPNKFFILKELFA